jgi:ATP-binding cassette subfamily E protein 1
MRVAVIKESECEAPDNCRYICADVCPVVRAGFKETVYARPNKKAAITEELCIACGICVKRCPFDVIRVINLPDEMMKEITFQYGVNTFRTFNIATPVEKKVVGLIGRNGIGKTTNINLISNVIKPNFGEYTKNFPSEDIIKKFRGKDIQPYLTDLYKDKIKVVTKPQDFELSGRVNEIVGKNRFGIVNNALMERDASTLSGGESQLVEIARTLDEDADIYIFDEPMNFLDIKHRLLVAESIRKNLKDKTVVVVEHDLVMLDYLTDLIQILYGSDANYGIVSHVMPSRNGINNYITGYLPSENVRFRNWEIKIKKTQSLATANPKVSWPDFEVDIGRFHLKTKAGKLYEGEVVGVIGENGIGKTTFMRALAGAVDTTGGPLDLGIKIAYKPQIIQRYDALVTDAFSAIKRDYASKQDIMNMISRLDVDKIVNKNIKNLSGGELQKVAIIATLINDAEVYLFDEPSANLDIEDRLETMSIISAFIGAKKKCAIVVDHDLMFLDSICSRSILFGGEGGIKGITDEITTTGSAINSFLKRVDVTMRRDKDSGRPRINLSGSRLDLEQKAAGKFFIE